MNFFDEALQQVVVNDLDGDVNKQIWLLEQFEPHDYIDIVSERYKKNSLHNKEIFIFEELIIVPFYILNTRVFELYDFELDILHMDIYEYILMKTGKKFIKSVDSKLINRYSKCFISLKYGSVRINLLLEYLKYILLSDEMKSRIPETLGIFEKKNLFFELY